MKHAPRMSNLPLSHRLRVATAACATAALAGTLVFAGLSAADESAAGAGATPPVGSDGTQYAYLDVPNAASGIAFKQKAYSADGPIVTELPDGRFVQRTPSENVSATWDAEGAYTHPEQNVLYNCQYLKADQRGCNACHDDLGALLDVSRYDHTALTNNLGIDITVQMCVDCHTIGDGYMTSWYDFGTMIHGIHQDVANANCNSCHNMTADGEGVTLWDVSKHTLVRGITAVEGIEGDFSWNQTDVIPQDDVFNFSWYWRGSDYLRNYRDVNSDQPTDTSIYDDWTITVSGEVGHEVTFTLADLIANAPVETKAITMQCTYNPTGGPYVANAVVTGIPLQWMIEQAGGTTDAAYGMYASSADGNANSMLVENIADKDALLVYQINGETLTWDQGFPCMLWVGGTGAPVNTKELSDLIFVDENDPWVWEYQGWENEDGTGYYNKPQVGVWGTPEGLCIQAGEPYTFKGYATSWDQATTAIEFSMDGGQTWTTCETPDAAVSQWVSWEFTWTPPEDIDTAYVLMVRAVTEDGSVTPEPVEVMVNAKSDLEAFAEAVRAAEGTDESLAANQAVLDGNIGTDEGGPYDIMTDPQGYIDQAEADGWATHTPDFDLWIAADPATDGNAKSE